MNTEQAINKAVSFAKRHGYSWVRLVSIRKKGNIWYVRLDVGTVINDFRTVKVDASGSIVGFTR